MGDVQADAEILELAIAREVDAYNFFMSLAEQVEDVQIRAVLENLAREELEHKAKLELEYIKTGRVLPKIPGSRADTNLDFGVKDDEKIRMSYKDIMQLGLEKEDASFKFYVTLVGQVHDQASRDVLMAIAEEEVKHKIRFEKELDRLMIGKKGLD